MTTIAKKRNPGFDFIKGLACICVVLNHTWPKELSPISYYSLFYWAVPVFVIVAGYFFGKDSIESCLKKTKHLAILTLKAVIAYVLIFTLIHVIMGDLPTYIRSELTLSNFAKLLLVNVPFYSLGILWYLFAMIYAYLAYALMIKFNLTRFNKQICIALFVGWFLLTYGLFFVFGIRNPTSIVRNWLFEILPFLLLGILCRRNSEKILSVKRLDLLGIGLFIGGFVVKFIQYMVIHSNFVYGIGSVMIVVGLLFIAMSGKISNVSNPIAVLGREYSLGMYLIHVPLMHLAHAIFPDYAFWDSVAFQWAYPFLVAIVTFAISFIYTNAKKSIAARKAA